MSSRDSRAKKEPTKPPEKRRKRNMQPNNFEPPGIIVENWEVSPSEKEWAREVVSASNSSESKFLRGMVLVQVCFFVCFRLPLMFFF